MTSAQLDLDDLLTRGAARLTRDSPALATDPALVSRLARVLGARLPCTTEIHWVCPVCRARTVTRTRCGPRCTTCHARVPASTNLLRQLPPVPVRHWVLTLPSPQRFELAGDPRSEATLIKTFIDAIFTRLRTPGEDLGCGAIAVVHRTGSALDLNLHIHALVADGVFHRAPSGPESTSRPSEPEFTARPSGPEFTARSLTPDDLTAVAREVHRALARLSSTTAPALATVQRSARSRRTTGRTTPLPPDTACNLAGLRLYTGSPLVDRAALRRVCDYITRPAAARLARATGTSDELLLPLPPQPDGSTHAPLTARDVVARLVAATPAEPAISVRSFGVLAPRAAHVWRLTRGHQLALPAISAGPPRPPRPPRCTRCDVPLEALAVADASDPPHLTAAASRTDCF